MPLGSDPHWVLISCLYLNCFLLNRLSPATPGYFLSGWKEVLLLLRVSLSESELWGLCPEAPLTNPQVQALSGQTPLMRANRPPSPRDAPENVCDLFCSGIESREVLKVQWGTVSALQTRAGVSGSCSLKESGTLLIPHLNLHLTLILSCVVPTQTFSYSCIN